MCIALPQSISWFCTCKKKKGGRGRGLWLPLHYFALKQTTTWGAQCASVISCYMNKTKHRGTCCPPTLNIVRWRQIIESMKFFVKKGKRKTKKSLLPWNGYGVLQGTRNKVPNSKKQCSTINPTLKLNMILNMSRFISADILKQCKFISGSMFIP
jgi:hypothetical protein